MIHRHQRRSNKNIIEISYRSEKKIVTSDLYVNIFLKLTLKFRLWLFQWDDDEMHFLRSIIEMFKYFREDAVSMVSLFRCSKPKFLVSEFPDPKFQTGITLNLNQGEHIP